MDLNPLPAGATIGEAPPPQQAAPNPIPEGASFDPTPLPQTPLPEGASFDNQLNPPKAPPVPPQATNTEVPGFWPSVGTAFTRGFAERTAADIAGLKVAVGQQSLQQAAAEQPPETQDTINDLLKRTVSQSWDDPKWWGVQIAHGAGGMVPGAGAAILGSAVRIPAPAAFALEGGLGTIVPAYKQAVAQGLDPESAVKRALLDSGISAATGAAMGLAPKLPIFGMIQNPAVVDQVSEMLKRPVLEALAQIGLVQPGLGVTGDIIKTLSHGESPNADQVLTDYVTNLGLGGTIVGAHLGAEGATRAAARALPRVAEPPATPDQVSRAFEHQAPPPQEGGKLGPEPGSDLGLAEEQVYPREDQIFYSPVLRAIQEKVPNNASPEQVLSSIKNSPGVKEEEISNLNLPGYLADQDGRVSKEDLIAHVEANSLQLLEERYGGTDAIGDYAGEMYNKYQSYDPNDWSPEDAEAYNRIIDQAKLPQYEQQTLPGWKNNYREFILKVPEIGPREFEEPDLDPNIPRGWQYAGDRPAGINERRNFVNRQHFQDQVNNIAHFRVSDRFDRDGRKLLHVEEVQSDLHQAAAKVGYLNKNEPLLDADKAEARVDKARRDYDNYQRGKDRVSLEDDPRFRQLRDNYHRRLDEFQAAAKQHNLYPDLPFKTSWQELALKRIMRLAADEGYDGISLANGDQVGLRLATPEQLAGARQSYDKKLPSILKKWANKLGMDSGYTELQDRPDHSEVAWKRAPTQAYRDARRESFEQMGLAELNTKNPYFLVNPAAGSRIRMGLPLYEEGPKEKLSLNQALKLGNPDALNPVVKQLRRAVADIGRNLKLSKPLEIVTAPFDKRWRGQAFIKGDRYRIIANTKLLRTPEDVYATLAHELGHVILADKFTGAEPSLQLQVLQEFRKFRDQINANPLANVGDVRRVRDNAVSEATGARNFRFKGRMQNDIPLSDLNPSSKNYLLHFEEWFAEQSAKWATTSEKPLSRVDKFFKSLGDTIRKLVEKFRGESRNPAEATQVMQQWLDSMLSDLEPFAADAKDKLDLNTKRANSAALDKDGTPDVPSVSQGASTVGGRNIISGLPPGSVGPAGPAMAAHADRMNKFYELMTSLPQIAQVNRHIRGLQQYKEIVSLMNIQKNNIMSAAKRRLDQWKGIQDPKQMVALNRFIEDYMNADFKLPHTQDGLYRRPLKDEFNALVSKHGLSGKSLEVFNGLVSDFDGFLEDYRKLLISDALRIKDPQQQLKAITDANAIIDNKLKAPYFPAMRFGKYTVEVYDHAGNIKHFEQTDSLRRQRQIVEAVKKLPNIFPSDKVLPGELKKESSPLLGMPPGLLDMIDRKLNLSPAQRADLDKLKFDYAPAQSFKHQFRQRDLTPGYATDFQRAYAHFFFHGANHLTRVQWVDQLRDQIQSVREDRLSRESANKIDAIANYMGEHLNMLVDPKPDFALLRGLMFHWFLGFNPASASLNLSQSAIMTYPHLASKFGDISSLAAMAKVGTDLNNFYKKGTIQERAKGAPAGPAGSSARALDEAIKDGVISESQAHTLAAISEDRNLLRAFGSKGEEAWLKFSEASSWMFELTEQYNRRVAFRAAWELAMKDPNNRYVQETVRDNPLQYDRLRNQGWTHQEAAAYTAAKDSVEKSQFVYAPYNRAKFMWGRRGSLFIFKQFTQNTLFNLWANKSMAARSLFLMAGLGGLMGLPGSENVNDLVKLIAHNVFGKDFDLEDQVRKFAIDVLHGNVSPDLLLHGTSAYGFGIPHVANALGQAVGGGNWFPKLDRSQSIGMGDITNIPLDKLFGPSKDHKGAELQALQRASGAGFGNLFALYDFLNSQYSLGDLKRWEMVMPKVLSNISHSFRYLSEGRERNSAGNTVVRFDPHNTEEMAEAIARGLGYQPRRLTAQYDANQQKNEAATFWDVRRGVILRQFGEAIKGGSPTDKDRVLEAVKQYNRELPDEWKPKAITSQALRDSVNARLKNANKAEQNLPTAKSNIRGFQEMDKYFPDARPTGMVDVRPVK